MTLALTLFGGGWILGGVLAVAAAGAWLFVFAVGRPPVRARPVPPPRPIAATYRRPQLALPAAPDPQR